MKTIVVSGINLFTGGTLKIMQECIEALSAFVGDDYQLIALVHNEKQHLQYSNVQYISFPKSRKSYFYRLYYEYIGFKKLSKQIKPYCWFSLHDVTPNVVAKKRMVYCHNSFPFYKVGLRELLLQRRIYILSFFSKYFYLINLRKNDYVVVQQEWMRNAFKQLFSIDNVVVSVPLHPNEILSDVEAPPKSEKGKYVFFYPATPMIHKNFEVICKAVSLLEKEGVDNLEVVLTINGSEYPYTRNLYKRYKSLRSLKFAGFLKREEVDRYYRNSDCLLFPSKIESWGLPVTEAKAYGLPVLISDLPYAKETVGKYGKAKFFNPDNARELADNMKQLIDGSIVYDETEEPEYTEPFCRNWDELIRFLLK
jgi:glycosyltransferase involved in cell wall biosynthesis